MTFLLRDLGVAYPEIAQWHASAAVVELGRPNEHGQAFAPRTAAALDAAYDDLMEDVHAAPAVFRIAPDRHERALLRAGRR